MGDLAGLYFESKEEKKDRKVIKSRTVRRTEEVRVDVHQEISNQRVSERRRSEDRSEDSSLGQSITITVTRSSKKNGGRIKDKQNKMIETDDKLKSGNTERNTDATSDDDTLNG